MESDRVPVLQPLLPMTSTCDLVHKNMDIFLLIDNTMAVDERTLNMVESIANEILLLFS
jgi:hypothetical protein